MKKEVDVVWSAILTDLTGNQDHGGDFSEGGVINPISGDVCDLDTASSALVFATEFKRTGNEEWRNRAIMAIQYVRRNSPFSGLNEPQWSPIGWINRLGSLYMTGSTIDMLWEAEQLLAIENTKPTELNALLNYLKGCLHGAGRFAHDTVPPNSKFVTDVQNTTAIALYLITTAKWYGVTEHPVLNEREHAIKHLAAGLRSDGFWPYVYPSQIQQVMFAFPRIWNFRVVRPYERYLRDKSIRFGDAVHHCYILYFLAKALSVEEAGSDRETLVKAWQWVKSKLIEDGGGGLKFDFSFEPELSGIRFCNFSDTTTYFIILATLPYLKQLGVLNQTDIEIADKLLLHVGNELIVSGSPPIPPHEDSVARKQKILPAIWQSVAWKGAYLSQWVRQHS